MPLFYLIEKKLEPNEKLKNSILSIFFSFSISDAKVSIKKLDIFIMICIIFILFSFILLFFYFCF